MSAECFLPDAWCLMRVRRFLFDEAAGLDPSTTDAVVLLGHELAANAVLHAGTEFEVRVTVALGRIKVTVSDREPHLPRLDAPDRFATQGRGLRIVAALSDCWGIRSIPGGKCVWFEIAVRSCEEASPTPFSAEPIPLRPPGIGAE